MEKIESKNNAIIKEIRKLKEKKYRVIEKSFIIEGLRFVEEVLQSDFFVPYIFISTIFSEKWEELNLKQKLNKGTLVYLVTEDVFKTICNTDNPQGILAVVNNKEYPLSNINLQEGFFVLGDKIQDPGNMGTIIRTSHAAGALGVIYTRGTVDIYNDKTLRATMGSIFKVPVIEDNDLDFTNKLRKSGYKLISTSLDTEQSYYDLSLTEKVIIVVGNEGNGVSKEIHDISDEKVKLPMPGHAESLNVAMAAGIMMYEIVRQNYKINRTKL